ncbi:MAG: hypothetical protein E6I48_04220 [Chloroflexi bacterium]|nr:MAG: hypothetical protein E6I48_04220 [Chloroflexota bacterium]
MDTPCGTRATRRGDCPERRRTKRRRGSRARRADRDRRDGARSARPRDRRCRRRPARRPARARGVRTMARRARCAFPSSATGSTSSPTRCRECVFPERPTAIRTRAGRAR